jgi:hypothetical protein
MISKKSIELIIQHEIGGRAVYDKKYNRPIWAGGESGVTIGFGFDMGYTSEKQFMADWSGAINLNFINALRPTIGIKGIQAKAMLKGEILNVRIPYNTAYEVFVKSSLPRYYAMTKKIYPNMDLLNDDTKGALVSVVYNRGNRLEGDSRAEMRAIVDLIAKQDYEGIAEQIEKSKRLWENRGLDGLVVRRESEADLIRESIC